MSELLEHLNKQFETLHTIEKYVIEIGVVDSKTNRKDVASIGLTNAEVLYINEHGSPINKMPPRPVLKMTIRYAQKSGLIKDTIDRCTQGVIEEDWSIQDIERELGKLCMRMENYVKDLIMSNDGRLAKNAPSTMAAKARAWHVPVEQGNHPLFMTGQLVKSITCRFRRQSSD